MNHPNTNSNLKWSFLNYIYIYVLYIHITVWEKNTTVWVTKATSMQGFATFHAVMKYIDIDLEIRLIHNDIIVNIIKVYYIIHVISKSCQSLYIYIYIYIRVCVCFLKVGCWSYLEVLGKSSSDWSIFGKTWHNMIGNPAKVKQLRSAAHAASDIWASLTRDILYRQMAMFKREMRIYDGKPKKLGVPNFRTNPYV